MARVTRAPTGKRRARSGTPPVSPVGQPLRPHRERGLRALRHLGLEEVVVADELRHPPVRRGAEDLPRRPDLLEAAPVHHHHAVGQGGGLELVVGHVDRGGPDLPVDAAQLPSHVGAQRRVQIGQRLVQEEHAGLADQGARQRHPLLLPARQIRGGALVQLLEPHQPERVPHAAADLGPRDAPDLEGVGDIAINAHVGPEGVALEDHAQSALVGGDGEALFPVGHHRAADGDPALVRAARAPRCSGAWWSCHSRRGPAGRGIHLRERPDRSHRPR